MLAEAPRASASMISGEWVLWFGTDHVQPQWPASFHVPAGSGVSFRARLGDPAERPLVTIAQREGVMAFVDGLLNETPWRARVGERPATPAELLLGSYLTGTDDFLKVTRGSNARALVDSRTGEFVAARDPLGVQPLFYAAVPGGVFVSPSIDKLLAAPGVSHDLSREALADHLCGRWPDPEETYYVSVRRVPAGHVLRWRPGAQLRVTRYWDPYPAGSPIPWLRHDEIELFDRRFEQAVARCLVAPQTGIFLSGGLDSVSVAALAVDERRRRGGPLPVAYSLGFPNADCDEKEIQTGVAAGLGMRSELLTFDAALGGRELTAQALAHCPSLPSPMMHTWTPAYSALATRARQQGMDVILTGGGGDEWLSISPTLTADYLRTGNLTALARLLWMWTRSYEMTAMGVVRGTVWRFGVRPLASLWLGRLAPTWWQRRRSERLAGTVPDWVAPDPALRTSLDERAAASMQSTDPEEGFYLSAVRRGISHPLTSMEFEESELFSRRHGLRTMRPFFDVDLVELLYRMPPDLLIKGGRAKGPVREAVARRFPTLGFERQKKRAATQFFRSLLRAELPGHWERMNGPQTLASMGIVSPEAIEILKKGAFSGTLDVRLYRTWSILNLEQWVRHRTASQTNV